MYIFNIIRPMLFCLFFLLSIQTTLAQLNGTEPGLTNVGFAPFNLTAPSFNCEGYVKAIQPLKTLNIALLYNTFGNDFSCLKRILNDPRLEVLEINLINEPGHRNNRLGSYEFLKGVGSISSYNKKLITKNAQLHKKFKKYVHPLKIFLEKNANSHTTILINPGLESNVSTRAGRVLISWTREEFPTARIVWNPLKPQPRQLQTTQADLLEGHGLNPNIKAPCVYNMDGTDVSYPNRPALGEPEYVYGTTKNWVQNGRPLRQLIEEFANRCEVAFVWTAESNGLDYKKKSFVDPRKRNHFISEEQYKIIMSDVVSLQRRGKIYPTQIEYSENDNKIVDSCDVVLDNFSDGAKSGRLLKQSEFRDRGGVLILTPNFSTNTKALLIKGDTVVDRFFSSGLYKSRPLFRSNRSPTTYPFNTYLILDNNQRRTCYQIPNPRIRID